MRNNVDVVLVVAGAACITGASWGLSWIAGLFVLGFFLIAAGVAIGWLQWARGRRE